MIKNIVNELRKNNIQLSDEEVKKISNLCERKMQVAGVKNQEEYFPLLFEDEIKNYLFRRAVTSVGMMILRNEEKEYV